MNLRKMAEGQACTLQLPGCHYGGGTVILAHIRRPWNAGVGMKPKDHHGVFACQNCHDLIDRRTGHMSQAEIDQAQLDALMRTISVWVEA